MTARECGACDACCMVLGVKPLGKPAYQRCSNQVSGGGCGIYETRPDPCRLYRCAWIEGVAWLEGRDRPDRLGLILDRMAPAAAVLERAAAGDADAQAAVDAAARSVRAREVKRGAFGHRRVKRFLEGLKRAGMDVFLVPFAGRRLPVGKPL